VAKNSGSMYKGVPIGCMVRWRVVLLVLDWIRRREIPKSLSLLTKLTSRRMLAGFRSPWTGVAYSCAERLVLNISQK
jgi:hypothetical protein